MDFFQFLNFQIEDNLILEDELALAKLAALVPELCEALRLTLAFTELGKDALIHAEEVISQVIPAERFDVVLFNET